MFLCADYAFALAPGQTPLRDQYFIEKIIGIGENDGVQARSAPAQFSPCKRAQDQPLSEDGCLPAGKHCVHSAVQHHGRVPGGICRAAGAGSPQRQQGASRAA